MQDLSKVCVAVVVLVLASVGPAAQARAENSGSKDWSYDIAPYFLWAMGLDGEVTVKGSTADVDLSFSDILDELDFIFDFHFEAHNTNGWGYILEPTFIQLESEASGPLGGDITAGTDVVMVEGLVTNRFGSERRPFELLWGARYMSIDSELDFSVGPTVDGEQSWLDGVVGVRFGPKLSERWVLSLRGDVGAGGSDLSWNAAAILLVQMSQRTQLAFGYRHMDIDYEDGDGADLFQLDVSLSGPIAGVNISF